MHCFPETEHYILHMRFDIDNKLTKLEQSAKNLKSCHNAYYRYSNTHHQ